MTSDVTAATIDTGGNVVVGKENQQQTVNVAREHDDLALFRLENKLDRMLDRMDRFEGRIATIERHYECGAVPLNWNIIALTMAIALIIGGLLYVATIQGSR